jgi:hypothetical protein
MKKVDKSYDELFGLQITLYCDMCGNIIHEGVYNDPYVYELFITVDGDKVIIPPIYKRYKNEILEKLNKDNS